ncbi:MAG: MBL fold metallo-hydrolase [Holophagales bacterium]|jgi:glyoxylase-like metal-dependent hydrolase (beta-lactamase superfamily II)|nr:MBL fold metallo-hydrolase [Holophagales bacterium]
MLNFEILTVGPLGCNCVLLWDAEFKAGVAVDTGDEAGRISERVDSLGVNIQAILLTHAHFDHVGGALELQNHWKCPVLLHPDDIPLLERINEQTAHFRSAAVQKPNVTPINDELPLEIKTAHTPGHSPGSSIFLFDSVRGKAVLSGDTLFSAGVGRSDLMGGSWEALENSIRAQLYTLDPGTLVIPGHGPNTTIGIERGRNPYVRG